MEEKATHHALQTIHPGRRPFLISRSTFPSSGRWSGHWLGDNSSKWKYMLLSIQGVLQFQLFQVPFVGADTCGFMDNTDEELCNRWMQLSAFMPFYRNHNQRGALSQEPYRWDSVANATRIAINARYSLLPYWVRLSHDFITSDIADPHAVYPICQRVSIWGASNSCLVLRVPRRARTLRSGRAISYWSRYSSHTRADAKCVDC